MATDWEQVLRDHGLPVTPTPNRRVIYVGSSIDLEGFAAHYSTTADYLDAMIEGENDAPDLMQVAASQVLATVTIKERAIYHLRFETDPPLTQEQVGEALQLHKSSISRYEKRLLRVIKAVFLQLHRTK